MAEQGTCCPFIKVKCFPLVKENFDDNEIMIPIAMKLVNSKVVVVIIPSSYNLFYSFSTKVKFLFI